jgi:hypothetical protein
LLVVANPRNTLSRGYLVYKHLAAVLPKLVFGPTIAVIATMYSVQRRAPKTVASAKNFRESLTTAPHTNLYGNMQLLIYSCNYYSFYIFIYIFIYVFKLIVLFLILVWRQIIALRGCLRKRRHNLRDSQAANVTPRLIV